MPVQFLAIEKTMNLLSRLVEQRKLEDWQQVPDKLISFLKAAGDFVPSLREALRGADSLKEAHWNPDRNELFIQVHGDDVNITEWQDKLANCNLTEVVVAPSGELPETWEEEPWILVKKADPVTETAASLANFMPSSINKYLGGPTPLAATLTGGLLGAGLGYGGGWLAEKLLGEKHLKPGRLSLVAALAGGGLGAAPGLWWGATSHRNNPDKPGWQAWIDNWPVRPQDLGEENNEEPKEEEEFKAPASARDLIQSIQDRLPEVVVPRVFKKIAFSVGGAFAIDSMPTIPKNQFGQTVWQDQQTPLPIRAATTGLLESASALRGGTNFVSPMDVARIGLGMGSGYLSGAIVGRTLGALAGLQPDTQKSLQQAGTWAGILTNVVPMAFGK
jgi:hypothetical protein